MALAELKRAHIVHETPNRVRLRCTLLYRPELDLDYVKAILSSFKGVTQVRLNPRAASITVHYDGRSGVKELLVSTLDNLPQEAYLPRVQENDQMDLLNVTALGAFALVSPFLPRPLAKGLSWLAAAPTLMKGVETLLSKGVKVEVLDAAAVGMSLARADYFTANAIVALLTLGRYLEYTSDKKSVDLLTSLLKPQVEKVWVEIDGAEVSMAADQLEIGSLVIVGSGEMIPVDGRVEEGEASLNQSSITGEAAPRHVAPGDAVLSGAVVQEGRIKIKAGQVGNQTSMARVNRFLENSLRHKSEPERRTEELADKLVPFSLGLGLAEYAFTRDFRRAASVLTVDYSCALKLAGPVGVRTSMYNASQSGVMIKGAQALESMAGVDTIVFDKTGTLTTGDLKVTQVVPFNRLSEDRLLAMAAGAEEHYTHPVAKAVVKRAEEKGLPLPAMSQVDFIVAHGISAYVDGIRVLVGSHHFICEDEGVDTSQADLMASKFRQEGKSILYVARKGVLEGLVVMEDEVRPEAPMVLKNLKEQGLKKIVVLTGDHMETARHLADNLGEVDQIHWELKPEDKAEIVKGLQAQGTKLAFVGDGVNDAPALVSADVGICMPLGADLARESAQVLLMHDDLRGLAVAREIAVRSQSTLNHCFRATLALNTAVLALASMGVLSPLTSAIMHNTSTILTLGYATTRSMAKTKMAEKN
ncbi:heavy metal translocating P-type ATPase [Dethiosulfatarculus sandiegensis]|uniref:heavy metal translocating P-type ATPase n=1 Tax=Dethiosulfatarculus sandiegensis TaxID=1429043 RepID=UPI00069918E6|nr:heavy metal translocating P-type ATPase [Dethiosulfatarculus sandiegensis]